MARRRGRGSPSESRRRRRHFGFGQRLRCSQTSAGRAPVPERQRRHRLPPCAYNSSCLRRFVRWLHADRCAFVLLSPGARAARRTECTFSRWLRWCRPRSSAPDSRLCCVEQVCNSTEGTLRLQPPVLRPSEPKCRRGKSWSPGRVRCSDATPVPLSGEERRTQFLVGWRLSVAFASCGCIWRTVSRSTASVRSRREIRDAFGILRVQWQWRE